MKQNKEHLEDRNRKLEKEVKEIKNNLNKQLTQKSEEITNFEIKL